MQVMDFLTHYVLRITHYFTITPIGAIPSKSVTFQLSNLPLITSHRLQATAFMAEIGNCFSEFIRD